MPFTLDLYFRLKLHVSLYSKWNGSLITYLVFFHCFLFILKKFPLQPFQGKSISISGVLIKQYENNIGKRTFLFLTIIYHRGQDFYILFSFWDNFCLFCCLYTGTLLFPFLTLHWNVRSSPKWGYPGGCSSFWDTSFALLFPHSWCASISKDWKKSMFWLLWLKLSWHPERMTNFCSMNT